jgi:hypothetical protein
LFLLISNYFEFEHPVVAAVDCPYLLHPVAAVFECPYLLAAAVDCLYLLLLDQFCCCTFFLDEDRLQILMVIKLTFTVIQSQLCHFQQMPK